METGATPVLRKRARVSRDWLLHGSGLLDVVQNGKLHDLCPALQRGLIRRLRLVQLHHRLHHVGAGRVGNHLVQSLRAAAGKRGGGGQLVLAHAVVRDLIRNVVFVLAQIHAVRAGDGGLVAGLQIVAQRNQVVQKIRARRLVGDEAAHAARAGVRAGDVHGGGLPAADLGLVHAAVAVVGHGGHVAAGVRGGGERRGTGSRAAEKVLPGGGIFRVRGGDDLLDQRVDLVGVIAQVRGRSRGRGGGRGDFAGADGNRLQRLARPVNRVLPPPQGGGVGDCAGSDGNRLQRLERRVNRVRPRLQGGDVRAVLRLRGFGGGVIQRVLHGHRIVGRRLHAQAGGDLVLQSILLAGQQIILVQHRIRVGMGRNPHKSDYWIGG